MTLTDSMWRLLQKQISTLKTRQDILEALELSSTTYAYTSFTVADALALESSLTSYALAFITDALKPTEGSGTGTGVPAYFNLDDSKWKRASDHTDIAE